MGAAVTIIGGIVFGIIADKIDPNPSRRVPMMEISRANGTGDLTLRSAVGETSLSGNSIYRDIHRQAESMPTTTPSEPTPQFNLPNIIAEAAQEARSINHPVVNRVRQEVVSEPVLARDTNRASSWFDTFCQIGQYFSPHSRYASFNDQVDNYHALHCTEFSGALLYGITSAFVPTVGEFDPTKVARVAQQMGLDYNPDRTASIRVAGKELGSEIGGYLRGQVINKVISTTDKRITCRSNPQQILNIKVHNTRDNGQLVSYRLQRQGNRVNVRRVANSNPAPPRNHPSAQGARAVARQNIRAVAN